MSASTVLIADDEEVIVDGLRAFLEAKGYKVLSASNGAAAVELALRERPAVLVLDLKIPKMSGVEVCRKVRAAPEGRGIKILVATGMGRQEAVQEALAAGADGYLLKPFGGARLMETLEKMLAK